MAARRPCGVAPPENEEEAPSYQLARDNSPKARVGLDGQKIEGGDGDNSRGDLANNSRKKSGSMGSGGKGEKW